MAVGLLTKENISPNSLQGKVGASKAFTLYCVWARYQQQVKEYLLGGWEHGPAAPPHLHSMA